MAVQCINASDICDGRQQCSNGMDEAGCCQPGHFRCPIHWGNISPRVIDRESSVCLSPRMTCDGIIDCPGGEDESEALCRSEVDSHMPGQPDPCPEQGYVAAGIKCCVPSQYICDGHADCLDGADERNCSNGMKFFLLLHVLTSIVFKVSSSSSSSSSVCMYCTVSRPTEHIQQCNLHAHM